VVDPLADKYTSLTPYNYTLNNPTNRIDPDGKDVIKPTNNQILWAIRQAYRTSSTYRTLHNKVLNNASQRWMFKEKGILNSRATTISFFAKIGTIKISTITKVNVGVGSKIHPAGRGAVETMTNEATHANEQGKLKSQDEQKEFYNPEKNTEVVKSNEGVCTKTALANEKEAGLEYYEDSEEDKKYQNLSDEELDKLIFTQQPVKEPAEEEK
jgi:hypothetical protein